MKDQLAAPKNILLLSDDQQASAEIAELLTQSTMKISRVSSNVLSPDLSKDLEGLEYDVAVISISEPAKFDHEIVEELTKFGIFNSPVLLISVSEVTSTALQFLRDKCGDFFLREYITPVLLACSIGHLISNCRLQNTLHETKTRHAAVLGAVAEGVITCDPAGDIQSINPAAEQILGLKSVKASGKSLMKFLASDFQSELKLEEMLCYAMGADVGIYLIENSCLNHYFR